MFRTAIVLLVILVTSNIISVTKLLSCCLWCIEMVCSRAIYSNSSQCAYSVPQDFSFNSFSLLNPLMSNWRRLSFDI